MRILLTEDEKSLSDALCSILRKQKYEVDAAYDGEEGLDFALSGIYDVILLDVMMPKLNGFEMLSALRKKGVKTPVLMLTALSQTHDKIKGLDAGADDYLAKPFETEELLARIRALLRRNVGYADKELCFGDLTLSLTGYTLSSGEKSIKLSGKEYEIMRFMLQRPSFVAEKEEIISKVWGWDNDFESNNLEAYMSFLRKKLVFLQTKVTISAVRGVGYQLTLKQENEI
jgi:DNA-binding response OmpR family regulator